MAGRTFETPDLIVLGPLQIEQFFKGDSGPWS